jgi:hypothetical protein
MTEQEFKDYIADEVLLAIKGEMMWEFTKLPDPITKRYTMAFEQNSFGSSTYTSKSPLGVEIPANSTLFIVGLDTPVENITPIFTDTTVVTFDDDYTNLLSLYYDVTEVPYYRPQSIRTYNAILNETLIRVGATDITEVPDKKLRDYGRREAWRHIMWATVGDYGYSSEAGGVARIENHKKACDQYRLEEDYILRTYSELSSVIPANSYNHKIKGVWK